VVESKIIRYGQFAETDQLEAAIKKNLEVLGYGE